MDPLLVRSLCEYSLDREGTQQHWVAKAGSERPISIGNGILALALIVLILSLKEDLAL